HAIADGVIQYVDAAGFGAGPHSLVIDHPGTGYSSLYGHLQQEPLFVRGDKVKRGDQIGVSGDPDGSCGSRPHLHLEIRSADYQTTYNPLPLIDANWHMLTSIGPIVNNFQQDLDHPYRWMKLEDQPEVHFSQNILNNYAHPWPPKLESRPPVNTPTRRHLDPLPEGTSFTSRMVAVNRWNINAWWKPTDSDAVYLIDAVPGQQTGVFRQPLDGSERTYVEPAPPTLLSPDGSVTVHNIGGGSFRITRLADGLPTGGSWDVFTNGNYPSVSPDGRRLLWEEVYGEIVPGRDAPGVEVWVSNLDGSLKRRVFTQAGGYSMWLDSRRILFTKRITFTLETRLYILDIDDPAVTPIELGSHQNMRGLQVSPGGDFIAYYTPFQEDPANSSVYVVRTLAGSTPQRLDFFGAYLWRDDRSLFTLSFDPNDDVHTLGLIDVLDGKRLTLSDPSLTPIRVANGDWSVSPDGLKIVYVDPTDYGLYMLAAE
ncbi:MAG: hypothetical protein EHM39_14405, partial [Chloroflexi bacterium]